MKQKITRQQISELLVTLESAHNAIVERHNLNLAEALIEEYVQTVPQGFVDQTITKSIYHAVQRRDKELMLAAIDAEIERLRSQRVKLLRDIVSQRKMVHYK